MKTAIDKIREDVQQTIKLQDCSNVLKALATEVLKTKPVYYCMYGGKKTAVVK